MGNSFCQMMRIAHTNPHFILLTIHSLASCSIHAHVGAGNIDALNSLLVLHSCEGEANRLVCLDSLMDFDPEEVDEHPQWHQVVSQAQQRAEEGREQTERHNQLHALATYIMYCLCI